MQESSEEAAQKLNEEEYEQEIVKLKYCLEIGKEAHEQENIRMETLKMRTENLVKYSTIFIAVANLIVSLADKDALGINTTTFVKGIYICFMVLIILCIILALIAQKPTRIEMFPNGEWMFNQIRSNQDDYKYENQRIYELILRYAKRTKTIRRANNFSLVLVMISYILYLLSIISLTILLIMTIRV